MLPASHRMRAGSDFQAAVRRGRRAGCPRFVVHVLVVDEPGPARVGFVVSRAVGGSVVRHRVARRLREAVRPQLPSLPEGARIVVRATPASATAGVAELDADVAQVFSRLGLAAGHGNLT